VSDSADQALYRAELEARLLELKSLLETEYDAIRERDTEIIVRIADEKQTLVERINAAMLINSDALQTLIDNPDSAGQNILSLLADCQQANQVNGAAIESSQSFTASLLDILRGRLPGNRTYTARGRLGEQSESGTLVRV